MTVAAGPFHSAHPEIVAIHIAQRVQCFELYVTELTEASAVVRKALVRRAARLWVGMDVTIGAKC